MTIATGSWIGLQDLIEEGHFLWTTTQRQAVYTNWASGEPDDLSGEDCVWITNDPGYRAGAWNDDKSARTTVRGLSVTPQAAGYSTGGDAPDTGQKVQLATERAVSVWAISIPKIQVSGGWSDWELQDSSTCSVTCGGGTRSVTYQRTCSNPATSCGGVTCSGSSTKVEEESCGTENCPEDGGWSPWYPEKNGSCSVTCGEGELSMTYVRHCDNPAPQFGGKVCEGNNRKTETFTCNTQECPIDGGWSSWYMEKNESCSVTCGGGEMNVTYRRRCDSPSPQYGGSDCTGDDIRVDTVVCNTQPCPIHGGWSSWYLETTSSCSVTCGVGELTLTYRRHCDSPAPQFGGSNCTGDNTRVEIIQCSTQSCPVDGRWSDWSQWHKTGECSALCGGGQEQQVRERECNNPAPASGGRMCDGDERENRTITCNHDNCADRCPQDSITFIAHTTNNRLYYQCDNGVAVLRQCGTGTVWDQLITTCVHDGSQQSQGHEQKTECDPTRVHQPHPSDCTKFLLCSNGQVYEMTCPDGLYFSDVIGACDWATSVTCERA
ncbi:hypothetical protein C0Q70_18339 [Pomacea canaliculata]|uniref:Chitinase n=1 Tax=Pomacea canaliculata TaxID=400727 RepID=A0A2T7NMY3_POMCA|nr:hypothetical protein C0Q70_18339 [Pomacea canaliculata]